MKISIIVPIYNVEKYLIQCIESLINQTYSNLEIILINDGSTDKSLEICEQYKLKDDRIILIDKTNGGLSDARNYGIEISSGEYIVFVDSDDYIRHDMIEILYSLAVKYDACIVQCNFIEVYDDEEVNNIFNNNVVKVFDNMKALESMYKNIINGLTWNKIYRKCLFENIRFPVGRIHEDNFTTYKLIDISSKIVYISDSMYYYRKREGSIMNTGFNLKRLDILSAMEEKIEYFDKNGYKKIRLLTMREYQNILILNYIYLYESNINQKEIYLNQICSILKKNSFKFIFNRYSRIRSNLCMILLFVNRNIFYKLFIKLYKR